MRTHGERRASGIPWPARTVPGAGIFPLVFFSPARPAVHTMVVKPSFQSSSPPSHPQGFSPGPGARLDSNLSLQSFSAAVDSLLVLPVVGRGDESDDLVGVGPGTVREEGRELVVPSSTYVQQSPTAVRAAYRSMSWDRNRAGSPPMGTCLPSTRHAVPPSVAAKPSSAGGRRTPRRAGRQPRGLSAARGGSSRGPSDGGAVTGPPPRQGLPEAPYARCWAGGFRAGYGDEPPSPGPGGPPGVAGPPTAGVSDAGSATGRAGSPGVCWGVRRRQPRGLRGCPGCVARPGRSASALPPVPRRTLTPGPRTTVPPVPLTTRSRGPRTGRWGGRDTHRRRTPKRSRIRPVPAPVRRVSPTPGDAPGPAPDERAAPAPAHPSPTVSGEDLRTGSLTINPWRTGASSPARSGGAGSSASRAVSVAYSPLRATGHVGRQKDVGRFRIPVQDADPVSRGHRVENGEPDPGGLRGRQGTRPRTTPWRSTASGTYSMTIHGRP